MSVDRFNFEIISEVDLQEMVDNQVPEGLLLDYKRDVYGTSDSDKREASKDVSAFANSHGGQIIIGIEEKEGIPIAIPGISSSINPDAEVLRLEQLIRSGTEPPILGFRIRWIQLSTGNYVIAIRIPRSWNPPHRVRVGNVNKFWIRNSGGGHEASMDELRMLFNLSSSAIERMQKFRNERIAAIIQGNGPRPLVAGARLILHIMPLSAFLSRDQVDLRVVMENEVMFPPIGGTGMSPRYNFEGYIFERGGNENNGYTQIFRNGILEATKAPILSRNRADIVNAGTMEAYFFKAFSKYILGLKKIGVSPPLVIMITLEGMQQIYYFVKGDDYIDEGEPFQQSILFLPDCVLEDYGVDADHHRAVKPAFDALWNAAGYSSAQSFNSEGVWVGIG